MIPIVLVNVAVWVFVLGGVGVFFGVLVRVGVLVDVLVGVWVLVWVAVSDLTKVGDCVIVGVGVSVDRRPKEERLSFVNKNTKPTIKTKRTAKNNQIAFFFFFFSSLSGASD